MALYSVLSWVLTGLRKAEFRYLVPAHCSGFPWLCCFRCCRSSTSASCHPVWERDVRPILNYITIKAWINRTTASAGA